MIILINYKEKDITNRIHKSNKLLYKATDQEVVNAIVHHNTFVNPVYESNEKYGYSNYETEPTIQTYSHRQVESFSLSRGFLQGLKKILDDLDVKYSITDDTITDTCDIPFLDGIKLRPYQETAVEKAIAATEGVIVAPTGSGKTFIALELIRRLGQRAVIVVHRKELAKQWMSVIKERMGIVPGFVGDGKFNIGAEITVAMVGTLLANESFTEELAEETGTFIVDECHHCPSNQFYKVQEAFAAKYRFGVSATPNRRDGLEIMIYRALGGVVHEITRDEVENIGATVPVKVHVMKTNFDPGNTGDWNGYLAAIGGSYSRNKFIVDMAKKSKVPVLVLVDRVVHGENISKLMKEEGIDHVLAHGKVKGRKTLIEDIRKAHITIGTTSLVGEGIDISTWSLLILASPISSEIKLLQAVGRIVRPSKGKTRGWLLDLKDDCGFSGGSLNKRIAIYKKAGINIVFGGK